MDLEKARFFHAALASLRGQKNKSLNFWHFIKILQREAAVFFFVDSCSNCNLALSARDSVALCLNCCVELDAYALDIENRCFTFHGSRYPLCKKCFYPLVSGEEGEASRTRTKQEKNMLPRPSEVSCVMCRRNPLLVSEIASLFFNEALAHVVFEEYKFSGNQALAEVFMAWCLHKAEKYLQSYDVWVPITLSAQDLMNRDFCTVDKIFKPLAAIMQKELVPCLIRKGDGGKQHRRSLADRKEFVSENYDYNPQMEGYLNGKSVLIIDDVITSGATINAAASYIHEHNSSVGRLAGFALLRSLLPNTLNLKKSIVQASPIFSKKF